MINGAGPGRGFAESFYPGSSNAIVVDPRSSGTALLDMPSPEYNLLVLGLSSVTPDGNASTPEALKAAAIFSLGDILKFFGPHWLADLSELSGFGPDLNFVLNAGGAGTRNCLAFQATSSYPTYLRLQFDVPQDSLGAFKSKFQARLSFLGSIDLRDACIICRKQSAATTSVMDGQTSTSSRITSFFCIQTTVVIGGLNLRLILEYATNGAPKLIIRFNDEKKSLADALQWILSSLEIEGDPTDLLPGSGHIYVRQLELQLGSPSGGGPFAFKGSTITLTLEVDIFDAAFFVVVTWSHSFRLHAYLWTDVSAEPDSRMLPWFEEYFDIEPSDPTGFDPLGPGLTNFLPSSMRDLKIPPSVDFRMTVADFEAWIDENKNTALIFRATLAPKAPATDGPALDIDSLSFLAKRTTNGAESSYEIDISTVLYLLPRNFNPNALGKDSFYAAQVYAALNIADGVWTITAAAYDIRFAALYSLLDASASESIMDVLEHFSVPRIEFEFVYGIDGFSVALSGALRISSFEIDLGYWYDSADKSWTFQGQLGFISDKAKITIADIVRDFDASIADVLDDIEFVKNIAVPAINKDATDFDSAPIQFYMTHTTDAVIMWFQIEIDSDIGAFTFLFAQYKPVPQVNDQGKLPARQKPKRLIRVRLDQLPELPNIPIVGSLGGGQPVDSISYVYVQDAEKAKTATTNTPAGFTRAEIAAINDTLQDRNAIKFRDKKSNLRSAQTPSQDIPDKNTAAPDYVLLTGHHFVVVTDGNVILDHQFGNKPATGKKDGNSPAPLVKHVGGGPVARSAAIVKDQATEGDSGATVGQSKRSFPGVPITIDNFGIQVKDKRLYLLIDATVMLGPIKLSLEGFGIGIPLSGISFAELKKPEVIKQFDFKLTGVGVYFNAPPVLIAGCFFHIDTDEFEAYRGGLAVSILPYTLLAVGSYEKTKLPKEFKSVFVFARLEGPLFTLEFAEISGVSAGFGYNYSLRMPTAADIQDFPLVHGAESDPDPMKLLSSRPTERSSFVNWNTRQESSLWFAIGMKVDAFQVLTVDAAAILSFSAESVKIALVGIASASMPPAVGKGKPPQAFIYVELGIVASLDILGGSLYVGAQLTPNSYILAPDCHLTGGFALCYWFGRNEHAGDWVFTVGGYHPAFQKPEHYPDVPRLGISWNLSDVLTVRGESYFAICPKACMGGGRLLATFNSGPIRASFEAWASFLINFKPFFFVADIGITLSVGCHIDFWIIHIHVEASLGADLHLQGPPFGGVAHVHFWVMGFSVYFGDQNNVPDPLSWKDFLPLVKQPGPGSDANKTAMCVIAIEKGSADEKTSKTGRETGDKWFVRAGSFQYRIETKFPIDSMDYGKKFKGPVAKTERIYGRPMQLQNPYTSTLHIEINAPGTETDPNPWLVQPLIRSLPKALWAQYSRGEDPVRAGNNIGTLLSGNTADATIDHLVGFTIRSPDPKLPSWSFPEFDAMAAMQEGVFQDGVTDPSEKPVRRNALLGPATEDDERPVLKGTPAPQTADLPVDKKPDVWVDDKSLKDGGFMDVGPSFDELEGVWKQVDEEATQLVADVWGDMMGWWGPEVPGGLVSSLSGKKPSWLMGAQERFETFYLEAPWLTKVTAAESAPVAA
ncbi:hypothetical protein EJ04DRAFT_86888 [Polyplosphaeria fusca]|uniref:DUF6603 domain-containing protein n=1 Tax=Polyplosphaeria fusca TaxID=682080 RepID=A0A9P4R6B8_9PLEO|nr:hypothetical protein EJ04DRAFT_86888 [Polyplosphaeria fusca]